MPDSQPYQFMTWVAERSKWLSLPRTAAKSDHYLRPRPGRVVSHVAAGPLGGCRGRPEKSNVFFPLDTGEQRSFITSFPSQAAPGLYWIWSSPLLLMLLLCI